MAKDGVAGKPASRPEPEAEPRRFFGGPRSLASLLPPITRPAFKRRAPAHAQVLSDWQSLVDARTAAETTPIRLSGGTLTLACSGPVALELQHMEAVLLARINGSLGRQVVERLRFMQDATVLNRPAAPSRSDRPVAPQPVAGLPDGPLHDALGRLGARIAARTRARS